MKLDTATCVYKCSLYTVGGCIYKLGKFVMANWDVAGIHSDIYAQEYNTYYSDIFGTYSEIHIRYINTYSETYTFRNTRIYSDI